MVLLTAAFVLSTVSCKQSTDSAAETLPDGVTAVSAGDGIIGTWSSAYSDSYAITTSTVTYSDGGYGYDWAGTVAGKYEIDSTSGYVYIKYTKVGTGLSSSLVGSYNAFAYKNLGTSSAQMATAYKSDGVASESSLSAAVTEFTISNGYYSYFGSYTK